MQPAEQLELGREALRRRDWRRAAELLQPLCAHWPDSADLHLWCGLAWLRRRRPATAWPLLQRAVELRPDDPAGQYNLGRCLLDLRRRREAEPCLRQALQLDPWHEPSRLLLRRLRIRVPRPTPAGPPLGDRALRSCELAPLLRHSLLLGGLLTLGLLLLAGTAALAGAPERVWQTGLALSFAAGGLVCAAGFGGGVVANLVLRQRGGWLVCVDAATPALRLSAVDPLVPAETLTWLALLLLLGHLLIGPSAAAMLAILLEEFLGWGGADAVGLLWMGVAIGELLLLGGGYVAAATLVGQFNTAAARRGGLRFGHRYDGPVSEVLWFDRADASRLGRSMLALPLLALLLPLVVLQATIWWPPALALLLLALLLWYLLPPLAVALYNGLARRWGGWQFELAAD
ncbi:MAG: tetratricopeptide repeat protein [Fimbriimonadaceae bacterium]|nr:tetratricopeptide repeat protein [Fimbriimonadaceae bacterium]